MMKQYLVPKIFGPDFLLDRDQVQKKVQQIVCALNAISTDIDERLGLMADVSVDGLLLVLAAILAKKKVALCPLREPPKVLSEWLNGLHIKRVVSSVDNGLVLPGVHCYQVNELRKKKFFLKTNLADDSNEFLSILRTSGSTHEPKSALLKEFSHVASAQETSKYFHLNHGSCWALNLPLYHVSGLSIVFRALFSGASIFVASNQSDLVFGLEQGLITHLSLVPIQLKRLFDENVDLSGLHAVVIGGDYLPGVLKKQGLSHGVPLFESYGMTETASMVAVGAVRGDEGLRVMPHAQVRIGTDQEVFIKSKSLFSGYHGVKDKKLNKIENGFFATGDLGTLEEDQLHLFGRKNNRIISGGENVQVEEVERVICSHPQVVDCTVVGVDHEEYGMCPWAFIKWRDVSIKDVCLKNFLRDHLAPFKVPKRILSWPDEVPSQIKKPRLWFLNRARLLMDYESPSQE